MAHHVAHLRRGGDRFEPRLNTASYQKTLKMVPTARYCQARDMNSVGEYLGPLTGANYHHVLLGLSDKGRAINGLVVCWAFLNLISLGVSHPFTCG